uniref:Ubiquinone biosynthesis protein n=1 Tax=Mesocestoides corti TaxID=53468 RepID=A0A5K3ERL2_MESCO
MLRPGASITTGLRRALTLATCLRGGRHLTVSSVRRPHGVALAPSKFLQHMSTSTSATSNGTFASADTSSSSSSDSDSESNYYHNFTDGSLEEACERALEAAISQVPSHGWTREAFEAACAALDLPPGLHSVAMPKGSVDLVLYFYQSRNDRLAEQLAKWRKDEAGDKYVIPSPNSFGFAAPPPFETKQETDAFLRRAIEYRLRAIDEVLPHWKHAMGLLALPQNIPAAIGLEAQIVDEIWAQAGDRSVDMNWYAKRLGLAYVYKLTELFYIQDASPDHQETWHFLDRRVADLRALKEAKLKGISSMLREGLFAAGHVTSNILGWNCKGC